MTLVEVPEDWSRGLAIVAHPDDLEYGSASAVAKWVSQGKQITYALVTRGEAGIDGMDPDECALVRSEEERRSAAMVGVTEVEFLDHADGMIEYGMPLRRDVARLVRRYTPEVIITLNWRDSWGGASWNLADHRNVGLGVLDGARDAGNRWVFRELLAEGLEPWAGAKTILFNGSPHATHYVDITGYLDMGIASLREHGAYIKGLSGEFDPDSFLRGSAEELGKMVGVTHAITYEVVQL